jgi:hypothetical protein
MGTTSEQLTAIDELRAQAQRISELETQLRATQRDLINARQHEKAIRLDERIKTTGLIEQAMQNGALCKEAPASGRNWLDAFWLHGYNTAQLRKNYQAAVEHRRRIAADFDGMLEDLRPTFELILENRDGFGAKIGERLAPVINEHFLKAFAAAPTEDAVAEAPEAPGGHDVVKFTLATTAHLPNGTKATVMTTDANDAFGIRLTTHEGLPTEYTTEIAMKRETLGVVLSMLASRSGLHLQGLGTIKRTDEGFSLTTEGALMIDGDVTFA